MEDNSFHFLKRDRDFNHLDYKSLILEKSKRLELLRKDGGLLEASKIFYKQNPISFIEDWFLIYDPRHKLKTIPFILYKRQREFILWLLERLEKKENGLVEKSRDVGVSYLSMAFALWMLLFVPEVTIGFRSVVIQKLDRKGDPSSLFQKGRMLLRTVPDMFLPKGFDMEKHCPMFRFINPETGSVIAGEGGKNTGRGGRATIYFKDEAAFYEEPEMVDAALSHTSDVKIDMSTVNGMGNPFYKKRFCGHIPVFIFDWKDDPSKGDKWYEYQKKVENSLVVKKEIDRDYTAGTGESCIPYEWAKTAVLKKGSTCPVNFSNEPVIAGFDVADEGGDRNVLCIRRGGKMFFQQVWEKGSATENSIKVFHICMDKKVEILNYDGTGVGAVPKAEFNKLKANFPECKMKINRVMVGEAAPKEGYNKRRYLNLKTYLWMKARQRLEKTFEYLTDKDKPHPPQELLFLLDDEELIRELSLPSINVNEATSLLQVETKDHLKRRGVKSTDKADALLLTFYSKFGKIGAVRI